MTELEQMSNDTPKVSDFSDVEAERDSLPILATLGRTKEYLGKNLTLAEVHKLSDKEVNNLHKVYQIASGQQIYNTLVRGSLGIFSKVVSHIIPIDSEEFLTNDLQEDKLLQRELSSFAAFLVLKGGRIVALPSALIQAAKYVKVDEIMLPKSETREEVPSEELYLLIQYNE